MSYGRIASLWVKLDGHTPFLCTVTIRVALPAGDSGHGCMSNWVMTMVALWM
jgi:hypothetical protein